MDGAMVSVSASLPCEVYASCAGLEKNQVTPGRKNRLVTIKKPNTQRIAKSKVRDELAVL
ncbi:hypothetical protein D3C86_1334610 [compost metagenome]